MDELRRLSYTADHIQHFGVRLALVYRSVTLSAALATDQARSQLVATVEAARLRDRLLDRRSVTEHSQGRIITTTEERDQWLFPKDENEVLKLYRDPDRIATTWGVKTSDRATPSARIAHVLDYIEGSKEQQTPSRSLVAKSVHRLGEPVFLYRGATLSQKCITEYEDHRPSVEAEDMQADFATAYCWSETIPGAMELEDITISCPVSLDIKGTWPGYANDHSTLEEALGRFMANQIEHMESMMHQDGCPIPWLEPDTECKAVGKRDSNINMEPAIFYRTSMKDGQHAVTDVEFFIIGRATSDIMIGQEALLDYGKNFWDKQGTVVAGMLDVTLLERRLRDSEALATELRAQLMSVQNQFDNLHASLNDPQEQARLVSEPSSKAAVAPCSKLKPYNMPLPAFPAQVAPVPHISPCATAGRGETASEAAYLGVSVKSPMNKAAKAACSPGLQAAGVPKSRLRKGWTGGHVGPTQAAHASKAVPAGAHDHQVFSSYPGVSRADTTPDAATAKVGHGIQSHRPEQRHSASATNIGPEDSVKKCGAGQRHLDAAAVPLDCKEHGDGTTSNSGTSACGVPQCASTGPGIQSGGAPGVKLEPGSAAKPSGASMPVGSSHPVRPGKTPARCSRQAAGEPVACCAPTADAGDGRLARGRAGASSVGTVRTGLQVGSPWEARDEATARVADTRAAKNGAKRSAGAGDVAVFVANNVALTGTHLQSNVGDKRILPAASARFGDRCQANDCGYTSGRYFEKVARTEAEKVGPAAVPAEALAPLQCMEDPSNQSGPQPPCKVDFATPVRYSAVVPGQADEVAAGMHQKCVSKQPSEDATRAEPRVPARVGNPLELSAAAPSPSGQQAARDKDKQRNTPHPKVEQVPSIGPLESMAASLPMQHPYGGTGALVPRPSLKTQGMDRSADVPVPGLKETHREGPCVNLSTGKVCSLAVPAVGASAGADTSNRVTTLPDVASCLQEDATVTKQCKSGVTSLGMPKPQVVEDTLAATDGLDPTGAAAARAVPPVVLANVSSGTNVDVRQVVDLSEMESDDGSEEDCMIV